MSFRSQNNLDQYKHVSGMSTEIDRSSLEVNAVEGGYIVEGSTDDNKVRLELSCEQERFRD